MIGDLSSSKSVVCIYKYLSYLIQIFITKEILKNIYFENSNKNHTDWYELLYSLNIFFGTGDNPFHEDSLQSCPVRSVVADYGCPIPIKRAISRVLIQKVGTWTVIGAVF